MDKIRVLIIDDSALMRQILCKIIGSDSELEVVGSVSNAVYALNILDRLKPDIVTLDIEMPEMDGITALTEIRKRSPQLPVIMCSSLTLNGAEITIEALSKGANDYVTKPSSQGSREDSYESMSKDLLYKIHFFGRKKAVPPEQKELIDRMNVLPVRKPLPKFFKAVVLGISTGGPNALLELIPKLPASFPVPIFIVQHMPALFTKILAESLDKKSSVKVKEAEEGDSPKPGWVYIAPGNYHMLVKKEGFSPVITLTQTPPENGCRPAADPLFSSAIKVYGGNLLGLVMTGMGQDGMLGCKKIKEVGGYILIQDEASSVVWGMPGAVAKAELADQMAPLNELSRILNSLVS